jgi:hypothetical protein
VEPIVGAGVGAIVGADTSAGAGAPNSRDEVADTPDMDADR